MAKRSRVLFMAIVVLSAPLAWTAPSVLTLAEAAPEDLLMADTNATDDPDVERYFNDGTDRYDEDLYHAGEANQPLAKR